MNILFIVQHPRAVDGGHPHFVPLHVVHVVLIDPELSAREGHSRHLVLQGANVKRSWDHVVEK